MDLHFRIINIALMTVILSIPLRLMRSRKPRVSTRRNVESLRISKKISKHKKHRQEVKSPEECIVDRSLNEPLLADLTHSRQEIYYYVGKKANLKPTYNMPKNTDQAVFKNIFWWHCPSPKVTMIASLMVATEISKWL